MAMGQPSHPYLYFAPQSLTIDSANALIGQVQSLIGQGVEEVTLLISSPGGSVYAGMLAYNFLRGCPIQITTHNINVCDSISAIVFAAGDRRLSVPHGRFLLHGVAANFPGGTSLSETQLEEHLSTIRNDADNIAGVLSEATGRTEAQIHNDMRDGLTLDPQHAAEYGLVHDIQQSLFPAGATIIQVAQ